MAKCELFGCIPNVPLAGSTKAEVLEGEGFGNWMVLIKFPSRALADECMNSAEYIHLSALRKKLSTGGNVFLIPA